MRPHFFIIILLASRSGLAADEQPPADRAQVEFFESKIRPVLVEHCYKCHSADSKSLKAGLRLDDAAATRHGGESGPAVVPGNTSDSLLLSAMRYESFEMPPDSQLPQKVIADFEKWIAEGAVDPRTDVVHTTGATAAVNIAEGRKFWAFQRPQASAFIAATGAGDRGQHDRVDTLVDRRLAEHGIRANGPADRRTLLRRISFDLIGLPPTHEQVQRFVSSTSDTVLEDTVEEMLGRAAFGQRWARMWLDVARYAEDQAHIVGSNKSLFYPNAWKYRDWVIGALNSDMPYDRFLQLQLAADLIEPDNDEVQSALGFIGLGPKYYRRSDPEVMAEEWEDRVDVVCRGLQGLTVACARCHDHKYDPIATADYYALAGVFASTEMCNQPLPGAAEKDEKKAEKNPEDALHVIREGKPRDLAVMIRGKIDNLGDVVPRGFLQVVFEGPRREFHEGSGRKELAAVITDSANPLTARVIVNRIWKEYFGRGLVATPSNFGQLGERPSHPELLDDLAVGFMQHGWSLKWLHRQIVLSRAYQRSSQVSADAASRDPLNRWLWRASRRRLSIEAWRDAVLSVSGRLDTTRGGKAMRPDDPEETRRTVYADISRFDLNPMLARFDFPDPNVHAANRVETNTPLQKLFLLNNPFMIAHAEHLAGRAASTADGPVTQVRQLFLLAYQRPPDDHELQAATSFLKKKSSDLKQLAQALLAANEFWYVD